VASLNLLLEKSEEALAAKLPKKKGANQGSSFLADSLHFTWALELALIGTPRSHKGLKMQRRQARACAFFAATEQETIRPHFQHHGRATE
jgi:hypothetical protein